MVKRYVMVLLTLMIAFAFIGAATPDNGITEADMKAEEVPMGQPTFVQQSILLTGQIALRFYMDLSVLTEEQMADSYMTFAFADSSGNLQRALTSRDDFDASHKVGDLYYFTCKTSPVQMSNIIVATFHYGDELTLTKTYSIKQYLETYDDNKDRFTETQQAVVEAMADYGCYTQKFLVSEGTITLGNKYVEITKHYAESYDIDEVRNAVAGYEIVKTNKTKGDITDITFSLSLADQPIINVYFKPAEGYKGGIVVKQGSNELEVKTIGGQYRVQIKDIPAHLLGKTYTLKVTTENGTATVKVSALSYVHALLTNAYYAGNEVAENAAASIYYYYLATKIYRTTDSWGAPTYEWSSDYRSVTATRVSPGTSKIETETVETTSEVTKQATCTEKGETTYTATFTNTAFAMQTKVAEDIAALGHDPVHHDAKAATCTEIGWEAYDTCSRCDYTTYAEIEALGHSAGESARENEVAATCTEEGHYDEVVCCSVCGEELSREAKTIAALGHAWGEPTWNWTGDDTAGYTAATATFVCSHDESHTQTAEAEITRTDGIGCTDYTATAVFHDQNYTAAKHIGFIGFYLIVPDWSLSAIDPENRFAVNPENSAEYMLTVSLAEGDKIKVVKAENGEITAWYPDGLNNEYTVDAAHAGNEKAIFFSESYRSDWSAFGGHIWIDASVQTQMNTFTHSDNFANVDAYLYRVGNGNTVALGSLFKVDTAGSSAVVSENVSVTMEKVETNSTVALGSYTKNGSDWTQSTLKFSGEGPVKVTIKEGDGTSYTLNLEIVSGNNATTATSATSTNIVLLNDVSGGLSVSGGKTLYGNGFSVSDTRSNPSGTAGYVNITNGTVDNVRFIGYEPTTAVTSGTSNAGYAPSVRAANGANLYHVYISGGRYALLIDGGTVTLKNVMLDGGAVGNMKLEGGTLILEDCITATSTRGGLKGLGIHLTSSNARITIKGTFEQHNWLTSNDMPSAYQSMLSGLFSNSTYAYTSGSGKYVNMGILGLIDGQNFYASSMQTQITDQTVNSYGYVEKTAAGNITGTLYTAKASMGSAEMLADPVDVRMQNATLPTFSFDYTSKNYIPNTGDDTFCIYDATTQKVMISLKQNSAGDTFDWDPMILEAKKYGQTLAYTVTMNDADYTDQAISFAESGDYTVIYTVTDPYNFDKDTNKSSVVYRCEVNISVTIIEPDAVVYHPEFSYAGDWSGYQATSVSVGGSMYIMPNAAGTSDNIASTTVNGTTVYMPIITVDGKNSSGGTYSSGKIYCFAPAFSAINIIDKNVNTGEVQYTYNSSTQKWPHNQGATSGPNRSYYGPNGERDPYGAGTGATYEKYAYNANNGGLCYTSNEIERDISANTKTVKFFYVGNDGITYYYYIQYKYLAVTYKSCVAEGTQILMADGTQKAVEDVQRGDMVMTWSFENGCYEAAPVAIKWYHGTDDYRVMNLEFSDGTVVRVINTHGFFDKDLNTYVYIREGNADDYIGHTFVRRLSDGSDAEVTLVRAFFTEEHVGNYSLQTAYNDNFIAENLLTITAEDYEGRFEYFPIGENMMYDAEAKARDIEAYGLYTYEEFADYLTEEQFIMFNGPYFKVLVGRGVLTYEDILEIIRVNLYENGIVR